MQKPEVKKSIEIVDCIELEESKEFLQTVNDEENLSQISNPPSTTNQVNLEVLADLNEQKSDEFKEIFAALLSSNQSMTVQTLLITHIGQSLLDEVNRINNRYQLHPQQIQPQQ